MREVVVAGVGMTKFARSEAGVRPLAEEAVAAALDESGVDVSRIEAAFFANAVAGLITGQEMIRGEVALQNTGLSGLPIVNVENACASASSAFHLAWMSVASGLYDVAVAVGSEKLTHEDKSRSFRAIGSAVDVEWIQGLLAQMPGPSGPPSGDKAAAEDGGGGGGGGSPGQGRSLFMDFYAAAARAYMGQSGATAEDFADVAVKNRAHAALNPRAQFRELVSREDVLASRAVADPLTLLMCSPIGDGAAAAVLCAKDVATRLGVERPVDVRASVLLTGRNRGPGEPDAVQRAARKAYDLSGVDPAELDVIELHDAAAPAELMLYEELGLCEKGDGPRLLAKGDTRLGGRHPVNTSGGLLSKGHPIGATGLAQIAEIVWQLQGRAGDRQVEGARVGLTENAGGFLGMEPAAVCVHVLST
ncbi:MAG: thiolase family protein [Actinobacteria bacterium]|nr:thiolase family protein [Actinomycetota bacterium]